MGIREKFGRSKEIFSHPIVRARLANAVKEVADKILERYAINELHYLASVNADIERVQNLVENWDYREVGHITIGSFRPGPDGGYAITDGNHRSVALALLLATHSITYQSVTAITAITQTHTHHRVYEDEYLPTV